MTKTLVRRVREGSRRTQAEAAERLGITPQTLSIYEGGRQTPSERRTAEIFRSLAIGTPGSSETDPRFLVSYEFAGQRVLTADGPLVFEDPYLAQLAAEQLENLKLDRVVIVPVWSGGIQELLNASPDRPPIVHNVPADAASAGRLVGEAIRRSVIEVAEEFERRLEAEEDGNG